MPTKDRHRLSRRGRLLRLGIVTAVTAATVAAGMAVANAGTDGEGAAASPTVAPSEEPTTSPTEGAGGEEAGGEEAGSAVAAAEELATEGLTGVNDFTCAPDAEHPEPVILVHGTFLDGTTWKAMAPQVVEAGFCVFALDYGGNALGPIAESAKQLQTFVTGVLEATGAEKVDIVGHSQGGILPRQFAKFLDGAAVIDDLVGLAPSSHGTDTPLGLITEPFCAACRDQNAKSPFIAALNEGGDLVDGPDYTVVWSLFDLVVTPASSQKLEGPAERLTNVRLQQVCPLELGDHVAMNQLKSVGEIVLNALERPGPADPAFVPESC